eukprot:TRINITY_DN30283_c0_g1_i2.p4 TRINITY_DN30283_c0_g1~~TRINITY_DN30283_c0_g1_i2.p4  ORF type:complete len:139 (-),score=4.82 TRINITY_DN30283_c0_g1_i2:345-761(-)
MRFACMLLAFICWISFLMHQQQMMYISLCAVQLVTTYNEVENELIRTLSGLSEAMRHGSERKGSLCKLVLSCEYFGLQDIIIYQKWCQVIFKTEGDVTIGYKLTVAPNPQTDCVTSQFYQSVLKYDMLAGCLALKQIL